MSSAFAVTRPAPDGEATVDRLAAAGVEAFSAPLFIRQKLDFAWPAAATIDALAVTSANALRVLAQDARLDAFKGLPLYAVGPASATAAAMLGFVDIREGAGTAARLAELLGESLPGGRVFYPAARERRAELAANGVTFVTETVYAMQAAGALPALLAAKLAAGEVTGVLHYSRRAAAVFCRLVADAGLTEAAAGATHIAISAAAAAPLAEARFAHISVAEQPRDAAMRALALSFWTDRTKP